MERQIYGKIDQWKFRQIDKIYQKKTYQTIIVDMKTACRKTRRRKTKCRNTTCGNTTRGNTVRLKTARRD